MPENTVEVKITGDATGVKSAMRDAAAAVKSGSSEMQGGFQGVGSAVESFKGQLSSIAASTGITAIMELTRQVAELGHAAFELTARATDIGNMAEVLNVSTAQFQVMGSAAEQAGVGQEKLFRGTERLIKMLDDARRGTGSAVESLRELGFTTQQIGDKSFGTADLLNQLRDSLNNAATATDTMQALVNVLGGRAALVAIAIKALPADMNHLGEAMREINGLTAEQIKQATELHSVWTRFGEFIENQFTKSMLTLPQTFAQSSFLPLKMLSILLEGAIGKAAGLGESLKAAGRVGGDAAAQIVDQTHNVTKAQLDALQDRIAGEKQGSATRLALMREYYEKAKQFYGSGEVDIVRAAHRALLSEEQSFQAEVLRKKKELASGVMQLDAQVQADTNRANVAEEKHYKQIIDLELEALSSQRALAVESLTTERDLIQKQYDARVIGADKRVELTRAALAREHAIEIQAYTAEAAMLAAEPVQQKKVLDQMLLNERKYQGEVARLDTVADLRKRQLLSSLNQGFNGSLSTFLKGAQTLGDGLRSLMGSVLDSITNTLADLATTWLTQQVAMAFATKAAAGTSAGAYVGLAGAAGVASFAAAPWPVDMGAPAFGSSMATAAAAFKAATFAASGGFDIPSGMNPVTQLHAKEMVLPAHLADPMRQFLSGGKAGGAPVHLHVHAADAHSVEKLFRANGHLLANELRRQARNFKGFIR